MTNLTIDDAQRRERLAQRHLLTTGPCDAVDVTRALVALHSTDPASVYLSAAARGTSKSSMNAALYGDKCLVRMLAMRRTMFVVPAGFAPVVHAATTRAIASRERGRLIVLIEQNGLSKNGAALLAHLEEAAMRALTKLGEAYGTDLGEAVPGLRQQITIAGGTQSLTTRVLFILAAEGRIIRGRPKGSWISSQYRWAPAPVPPPTPQELPTADAQIALARAYLKAYGPATNADVQWWTGWTAGETKKALAGLDTVAVALEGSSAGIVLAEDADDLKVTASTVDSAPSVRLLPALDPSVMGWAGRDFYLEPGHREPAVTGSLFDRSGNPGPTIWLNGRIVGGWAQRKDGEIAVRLLADVGQEAAANVKSEAARTAEFLGDVRVTPRFRTPLERELVS